jgi:CRP/FNR family cyclic AMP-dependent transcriptional regulator
MVDDATLNIMEVLTEDQCAELKAMGTPVSFAPEQTVFREGQPSHSVLLIGQGSVKVTQVAPDGEVVMLAARGANEVMGDEGVLMGEVRSATVTTMSDLTGWDIRGEDLLRFVERHQLWPVMYRAVVRRRRQADQRTMTARLDVRYLLARWLLDLANEVGTETDEGWVIGALTQKDLAGRIGASRDAVAIELRKLRESRVVTTGRRKIVLHDLNALRKITRT